MKVSNEIKTAVANVAKGTRVVFGPALYEVYNTTEGRYHAIRVLKNGDLAAINQKNLKTFTTQELELGLSMGVMEIM